MDSASDGSTAAAAVAAPCPRARRRRLPRPETMLLLLGLIWTIGAKAKVVLGQGPDHPVAALAVAVIPDLVFFAFASLLFSLLYLTRRPGLIGRINLLAAGVILVWSMLNAAWLFATGVQLQPGVLFVLREDFAEFWPHVQENLASHPRYSVPLGITLLAAAIWFLWRLVRPVSAPGSARSHLRRSAVILAVGVVCLVAGGVAGRAGSIDYAGEVVGFSSHWYAVREIVSDPTGGNRIVSPTRELPVAGARTIAEPTDGPRPNVLIILMESVSYSASSFADPALGTTPFLAELAASGVDFGRTHTPVPQTSKAMWTVYTGSTPNVEPDTAESVLVDVPYEGLATILGRRGYRSAFFEMSKGAFRGAPGMFGNLGFDWAWFRENLEDESASISLLNGDDFRMIEPMFEWVDASDDPFFLTMITSVSHDPFELPEWYPHAESDDRYTRYLQAVRFNDDFVKAVCEQLEQRGMLDDTIVCVLGDHGDSFRADVVNGRVAPFEEVLRVPWVMRWPAGLPQGVRRDGPCSQLDVTPTVLSALGYGIDEAGFDGVNALDAIPPRRLYFSMWVYNCPLGFIEGDRKVVYQPLTDRLFEFDLRADPQEKSPRIIEGERKEEIVAELKAWESDSHVRIPARRFRSQELWDHWHVFSAGRMSKAYYVP